MDVRIDALKRKDRDAWRAVYEQCVGGVYAHALYRLKNDRAAAEDVTQEVFLRAIESIGTFRGGSEGLLAWLRGIGGRIVARRARNLKPSAARPLSLDVVANQDSANLKVDVVDPTPGADERLARNDERCLIGAALTTLPQHWEDALRWKYCDGLSVSEVAERLGVTPKAAESLLSRARAAFRTSYRRIAESDGRMYTAKEWTNE